MPQNLNLEGKMNPFWDFIIIKTKKKPNQPWVSAAVVDLLKVGCREVSGLRAMARDTDVEERLRDPRLKKKKKTVGLPARPSGDL